MLKSRDSYPENVNYDFHLGNHICDVYAFGLSALQQSQVKFLIGNKDTYDIKFRSRMMIMVGPNAKSVIDVNQAKELVEFLELVKDNRVNKIAGPCGMSYNTIRSATGEYEYSAIKIINPSTTEVVFNSRKSTHKPGDDSRDNFLKLVDRLSEITKEFIKVVESRLEKPDSVTGELYTYTPKLESYFDSDGTVMIPLNHKYEGPFKNIYVSVYHSTTATSHVTISNGDKKLMLFPFINNPESSTLVEIIETFINYILDFESGFKFTHDKTKFVRATLIKLSDDRVSFMESISTRPITVPFGEETIDSFFFILNSNAVLGAPMTYFRYEPKFLEDLVNALKLAISDKFIK
jgi:hypothetical protein